MDKLFYKLDPEDVRSFGRIKAMLELRDNKKYINSMVFGELVKSWRRNNDPEFKAENEKEMF